MSKAIEDYYKLSDGSALCDYAFHLIVTDPCEEQMKIELPKLVDRGVTSVKACLLYNYDDILLCLADALCS